MSNQYIFSIIFMQRFKEPEAEATVNFC